MNWINVTKHGYIFDKRIFWGMFLCISLIVLYIFYINDFDLSSTHYYIDCKSNECENPLADMDECKTKIMFLWTVPLYSTKDCREGCDWCYNKTLSYGVYGKKIKGKYLYNNLLLITLVLFIALLILNHLIHNKGKKFDVEIPITKNKKINISDMIRKSKNENTED